MEKGEMRVELNLSISPDPKVFGTKVEVKNINSFSAVERAAKFEIGRMKMLYEAGREAEIVQETRGWDEVKQQTFSQRSKENSADYRYFPEPDIPKFYLHEMFELDALKNNLPELPQQKRDRYKNDFSIKDEDIESFVELIELLSTNQINSRTAKDILLVIVTNDQSPKAYAETNDLLQKNDPEALKKVAQQIIDANPNIIEAYKAGKESVLMSLVGQIMKQTNGSANPQMVLEILKELLR